MASRPSSTSATWWMWCIGHPRLRDSGEKRRLLFSPEIFCLILSRDSSGFLTFRQRAASERGSKAGKIKIPLGDATVAQTEIRLHQTVWAHS